MTDGTNPSMNVPDAAEQSPLERTLAQMTRWEGEEAALWAGAVPRAAGRVAQGEWAGARTLIAATVVILTVGLLSMALLPTLGKARSSARPSVSASPYEWSARETDAAAGSAQPGAPASTPAPQAERAVIRKATIEITSPDVRGVVAKAALLVSEAQGEFVQESSLTGEDATGQRRSTLRGQLTLRVSASRLSTVMQSLRELGAVASESSSGEDVTDQVVDLEARLANERRIEQELLELLASREGAALSEVLELRKSINEVRGNIERMTAQRERLSRLVSLATVLVIVRPEPEPVFTEGGFWSRTGATLARSLEQGVRGLVNSLAWLLEVLIGGLVFWVLLAAGIIVARIAWRRAKRAQAEEPPPVI